MISRFIGQVGHGISRVLARISLASRADSSPGRDPLGPLGERAAEKHLRKKGFRFLGRNLRVPMGEADLLFESPDGAAIVLVEVKARRVDLASARPAPPAEAAITQAKRAKLSQILNHLARHNNWRNRQLRIDVVAVDFPPKGRPVIRHHAGAVDIRGPG